VGQASLAKNSFYILDRKTDIIFLVMQAINNIWGVEVEL
jgi:hypothetical protein